MEVMKDGQIIDTIGIGVQRGHKESFLLMGRQADAVDIPAEHPSIPINISTACSIAI